MRFGSINNFYLLWGVILIGGMLFWFSAQRYKRMKVFAQETLLAQIAQEFSLKRVFIKNGLLILFFIFSVMAAVRPQWGYQWQEVKRQGSDIIIAIDTSKSMLTEDVKPNRLERTKLAVKDLIKELKGDRVGLVAFAGDAFMVCPLTMDYNGFLLSLNDLNVHAIPRGGTDIGKALKTAITGYENVPSKYKAVIILTDGENLEGDPIKVAYKAKTKGIKVYCVGIGTREGELIRVPQGDGSFEFLKDEKGNFVKSRLQEDLLQKIALITGGAYARAGGAQFGLDVIYEQDLSKIEKRDLKSKMEKKYYERFQIPLAVAIFFLFVETCLIPRKKE